MSKAQYCVLCNEELPPYKGWPTDGMEKNPYGCENKSCALETVSISRAGQARLQAAIRARLDSDMFMANSFAAKGVGLSLPPEETSSYIRPGYSYDKGRNLWVQPKGGLSAKARAARMPVSPHQQLGGCDPDGPLCPACTPRVRSPLRPPRQAAGD